jgi:Bacterial Ig-like domain (group 3)
MDGSSALGMGTLSDGVATFSTTMLSVGTHSVTAVYSGDDNFTTSTSAVLKQKVQKSASLSTAVVAAVDPAGIVQSLTAKDTYDRVYAASASATSRLVVGLGSVDGFSGWRPAVDHGAGSRDPRPTVDHGAGSVRPGRTRPTAGDPRPSAPPALVVDLAIGTLQDVDVIAVRARRRVR